MQVYTCTYVYRVDIRYEIMEMEIEIEIEIETEIET